MGFQLSPCSSCCFYYCYYSDDDDAVVAAAAVDVADDAVMTWQWEQS